MRHQHFDAAGHSVHDWLTLQRIITHKPSLRLLKDNLLCRLIIQPFIEIKVPTPFWGSIEVKKYGCGSTLIINKDVSGEQLAKLRLFYKSCWRAGWTVQKTEHAIYFRREARVMLDPLRRFL